MIIHLQLVEIILFNVIIYICQIRTVDRKNHVIILTMAHVILAQT